MAHSLAGQLVRAEDLIQIQPLIDAYYDLAPNPKDKDQVVSFGTSGHRGVSTKGTFNDLHVACIVQAVCDLRHEFGATGPCFVGQDTHALSQVAFQTALEVLAGNKVLAAVDQEMGFVPTPSISRAIIRYNEVHEGLADGLIITPSHNPPDNGGIKYNPTNGGPADTEMTKRIEELANLYLANYGEGIKRISVDNIEPEAQLAYDYKGLYVEELAQIIDMDAIKKAGLKVLVNGLGGSGAHYWQAISDHYDLGLTIINVDYDPTFSFMTYDHDGVVRMDCSSPYAMADVIKQIGSYDLAVGNDPDYDRYGVVTQEGLLNANYYLLTAAAYLFESRSWPSQVGVGKTAVVTSQ
ncbi:MAG: alpha-D-glucose phosphate-specific phosphoglucomutase, partial [Veillonella sp.]|nr:alpha-D-glucose phosphate-specific phosphoglucomutase [Veillonella sp.]